MPRIGEIRIEVFKRSWGRFQDSSFPKTDVRTDVKHIDDPNFQFFPMDLFGAGNGSIFHIIPGDQRSTLFTNTTVGWHVAEIVTEFDESQDPPPDNLYPSVDDVRNAQRRLRSQWARAIAVYDDLDREGIIKFVNRERAVVFPLPE